jgi:hypothetical protein
MRPRPMIVLNIGRQDAAQVTLIENDNVIETLAPDRANDPVCTENLIRIAVGNMKALDPNRPIRETDIKIQGQSRQSRPTIDQRYTATKQEQTSSNVVKRNRTPR